MARGEDTSRDTARQVGRSNYDIFAGTHADDPDTEHTWDVQVQKGKGKYNTVFSGKKAAQAGMMYSGRNVGPGYTKRIRKNGVVTHKTIGVGEY